MAKVTALGVDPGLSKAGLAVAEINPVTRAIDNVLHLETFATHRQERKVVRKTSDDIRRAMEHAARIEWMLGAFQIDFIAAEVVSATPHLYPTFSFGVWIGILASIKIPIIQVLPREVKKAALGNDRASKREIIAWAMQLPSTRPLKWPTTGRPNKLALQQDGRNVARDAEHPADALAVIQAALLTDQFKLAEMLSF